MPSLAARFLALGLLASAAACGPRASSQAPAVTIGAAPRAATLPAPAGPDALIWFASDDKLTTRWLSSTRQGAREIAQAPELILAFKDEVWRWSPREVKVPTVACTETNGAPPGEGLGTRVVLERLGASREVVEVVAAARGGQGENEIHQLAVPVGSVGPYLFVRETTYAYSCGAHGFTSVSAKVWDVAARRNADILEPAERATMDTTVRVEAEKLFAGGPDGEASVEDLRYVASLPRYGAHGWLSVEHAFTSFACYACGDGEWSSYTRSTNVPAQRLPERARPYAHPPAVVSAYLDEHRDVALGGWSELTPAAARELARALHVAEPAAR